MAKLGSAFVEIAADLKKLQAGFKQAQSDTNKFLKNVNKQLAFIDFTPLVKNLASIGMRIAAITAPVTVTGGALFMLAKKTADMGVELDRMSKQTGIAVDELYALKKLAELSGMGISQLSGGLGILAKNLTMARSVADDTEGAAGDLRRIFTKLGVDIDKPLLGVLKELAGVFRNVEDGEAKLTLAMKLFGAMAGKDMIPTLEELSKKGLVLSDTFTEKTSKAAKEFNKNLIELKQNATEAGYSIGNVLIPALNNLAEAWKEPKGLFVGVAKRFIRDPSVLEDDPNRRKWHKWRASRDSQKMELPADLFGTTETARAGDNIQTAKAIADTYKGMYDTLKFDAKAYYDYRAGALVDQREKEIEITGDITLAWQTYYARLKELDNERIRHSGSAMEGIKLFFEEEAKAPQSWASEAETAMGSFKDAMKSGAFSIVRDTKDIGDAFQNMASMVLDSIARIGTNMAINALFSAVGGMIGGAVAPAAVGTVGSTSWGGNTGFTSSTNVPTISSMSANSMAGGTTTINNTTNNIAATDFDSFARMLKRNAGTINEITVKGKRKSRNFEKSMK